MLTVIKKIIPEFLKKRIRLIINKGDTYICPFCSYGSKNLIQIGSSNPILKEREVIGAGLRYSRCFKCGSLDRERLLYLYLKHEYKLFEKNRDIEILHIAPEIVLSNMLQKEQLTNYVCGDLFADGYTYPDHVLNMNVLDIPYSDNSFDLVLCNHVLEHIPNDKDAMKEILRVLKPNARAILMVPISKNSEKTFEDETITEPKQREALFGQDDHVRIYGQDYIQRLQNAGFKVKRINLFEKYRQFGLNSDEELFIGFKPDN